MYGEGDGRGEVKQKATESTEMVFNYKSLLRVCPKNHSPKSVAKRTSPMSCLQWSMRAEEFLTAFVT